MARCPRCGEEINHLEYTCRIGGYEDGKYYIGRQDHEMEDQEIEDTLDYEYICPICRETVHINEVEDQDSDDQEDVYYHVDIKKKNRGD